MVGKQLIEDLTRAAEHSCDGKGETITALALDELAIEQVVVDMPVVGASTLWTEPAAKVCGDGVEVAAQAIAGEGGNTVVVQTHFEIMENGIGIILLAAAEMKRRDDLGDRVDGEPEPLDASPDFGGTTRPAGRR